jgi:hypothetical protein
MSKAINARKKGHAFELDILRWFNDRGFTALTSRNESKRKDDAGIDLCYTEPFSVQCKAVERAINHHSVLAKMPNDSNYNLIFHKKSRLGVTVTMTIQDFSEILNMLIKNKIIKP